MDLASSSVEGLVRAVIGTWVEARVSSGANRVSWSRTRRMKCASLCSRRKWALARWVAWRPVMTKRSGPAVGAAGECGDLVGLVGDLALGEHETAVDEGGEQMRRAGLRGSGGARSCVDGHSGHRGYVRVPAALPRAALTCCFRRRDPPDPAFRCVRPRRARAASARWRRRAASSRVPRRGHRRRRWRTIGGRSLVGPTYRPLSGSRRAPRALSVFCLAPAIDCPIA